MAVSADIGTTTWASRVGRRDWIGPGPDWEAYDNLARTSHSPGLEERYLYADLGRGKDKGVAATWQPQPLVV